MGSRGVWRESEEHRLIQSWVKGYRDVQKGAETAHAVPLLMK